MLARENSVHACETREEYLMLFDRRGKKPTEKGKKD